MEHAMELFAVSGYHNTSIASIAKSAGISKGLLYNYFESKEELLKSIVELAINDIYEFFDPNKDGVLTGEEFRFFVRKYFETLKEKHHFLKLLFTILTQQEALETVNHLPSLKTYDDFMQIFLAHFKKSSHPDAREELILFASIMKGFSLQYVYNPDSYNDETLQNLEERIIQLFK